MAFRLVVQLDGKRLRLPLQPGSSIIGSKRGSDLRIAHPTVSRRHARVTVGGGGVSIEDLGSQNGVRIGLKRVETAFLSPGESLFIGGVPARLEEVEEQDLEAAIVLGSTARGTASASTVCEHSTYAATAVEEFAVNRLPELLRRIEDHVGVVPLAQLIGEALLASLPCSGVEVSERSGGVVFSASRDSDSTSELEIEAGHLTISIGLPGAHLEEFCAPVVELAALVLRIGLGRSPIGDRRTKSGPGAPPLPDPPTVDPGVRAIYGNASRIATGDVSVVILGESGTGKEVLARYIHRASDRAEGPFLSLNCASLASDLLEAELFGIEKGVATGVDARAGKFELADRGTVFLDEIGDMSLETQAKILRVLQSGEVYRLGGGQPRQVDVRILSATNRDLESMLVDRTFREDLYHRIATWVVELPPLRRRLVDIPNLAAFFLARAADRRGLRIGGVSRAALDVLTAYAWPGNIRQLENEMARAVLFLEDGDLLDTGVLAQHIQGLKPRSCRGSDLASVLEHTERHEIGQAIADAQGNHSAAAKGLGISRSTLYRRMKALGLEP